MRRAEVLIRDISFKIYWIFSIIKGLYIYDVLGKKLGDNDMNFNHK